MHEQKVIIPEQLNRKYAEAWKHHKVILISAFCGCGKTSIVKKLLEDYCVYWEVLKRGGTLEMDYGKEHEVLVIENLHWLRDEGQIEEICDLIRSGTKRLVFTTRGSLPEWLLFLKLEGRVQQFTQEDLRFHEAEVYQLAELEEIQLRPAEVNLILEKSKGYALGIHAFLHGLAEGGVWGAETNARVTWEIFSYIEKQLFQHLTVQEQRFLVTMAPFPEFTIELANYVCEHSDSRMTTEQLLVDTTTLLHTAEDSYEFNYVVRAFVRWKFNRSYSEEEQMRIYNRGGEFYEQKGEIVKALEHYELAKNYERITNLLTENAICNPGIGHYYELERYYLNLPEDQVRVSPILMCGMSMLMSMRMHYEKSEMWYRELEMYRKGLKKSDASYGAVMEQLLYLDIALPQRSNDGLIEMLNKMVKYVGSGKFKRPSFSLTSRLPSVMNGGKDFSEWSKRDDILVQTLRKPLEIMLHNDGIGVLECGLCESKLEKGKEYSVPLKQMMEVLPQVQQLGTSDVEFAIHGVIARIYISQGKSETAKKYLVGIRDRFLQKNETRFSSNIEAMLCRIALLEGDVETAVKWREKQAPQEDTTIWTMWRFQYLVKVEVLIQESEYVNALLLLTQLLYYTKRCNKVIDEIQVHTLMAICYYRMEKLEWKESVQEALSLAQEYDFTNTIARYGGAILPLLSSGKWKGNKVFLDRVLKQTRVYTSFYQLYLKNSVETGEKLSVMELTVLRLICQNKSNQEICDILGIKLPTVKTHASNIYRKLDVKRRAEAKSEAIRRNLVEEYI